MKHVASGVTVEFMKSLYITEDGDHKVSWRIGRERVSWQNQKDFQTDRPSRHRERSTSIWYSSYSYLPSYF